MTDAVNLTLSGFVCLAVGVLIVLLRISIASQMKREMRDLQAGNRFEIAVTPGLLLAIGLGIIGVGLFVIPFAILDALG